MNIPFVYNMFCSQFYNNLTPTPWTTKGFIPQPIKYFALKQQPFHHSLVVHQQTNKFLRAASNIVTFLKKQFTS